MCVLGLFQVEPDAHPAAPIEAHVSARKDAHVRQILSEGLIPASCDRSRAHARGVRVAVVDLARACKMRKLANLDKLRSAIAATWLLKIAGCSGPESRHVIYAVLYTCQRGCEIKAPNLEQPATEAATRQAT